MNSSISSNRSAKTSKSANVNLDTSSKSSHSVHTGNEFMKKFLLERSKSTQERKNPLRNLSSDKLKTVESWINQSLNSQNGESEDLVRVFLKQKYIFLLIKNVFNTRKRLVKC
jgi:hypothetical protein